MSGYMSPYMGAEENAKTPDHEKIKEDYTGRNCGGICVNINDACCAGICNNDLEKNIEYLPLYKEKALSSGKGWIPLTLLGESPDGLEQTLTPPSNPEDDVSHQYRGMRR